MRMKATATLALVASLIAGMTLAATGSKAPPSGETPATQARLATKAGLVAVARAGDSLVAVGDFGTVVRSTDGGLTWSQAASVPVSGLLTAVSFADPKNGWAVGHGGVILVTRDGGNNWAIQHVAEGKPILLGVHFTDASHGYAVGAYGTALSTVDGGKSWTPMPVGEGRDADLHLNHIFAGRDGALFAAGESGAAFRSRDGGAHWERLHTGVSGSLWGGLARRDGRVLLLGMSGRVLESSDGGSNWKVLESGTSQALTGGIERADGGLVLVGSGGAVVASRGEQLATVIRADRQNLAAVVEGGGALVLLGQSGILREPAGK